MPSVKTDRGVFAVTPGETLLAALERTGHEVEYQCREGYCGSCALALRCGTTKYVGDPIAFVAEGQVLACCSVPVTDVELDIF